MNKVRRTRRPFGSGRYFWANGGRGMGTGWYYEMREGIRGPFASRTLAEASFQQQSAGRVKG